MSVMRAVAMDREADRDDALESGPDELRHVRVPVHADPADHRLGVFAPVVPLRLERKRAVLRRSLFRRRRAVEVDALLPPPSEATLPTSRMALRQFTGPRGGVACDGWRIRRASTEPATWLDGGGAGDRCCCCCCAAFAACCAGLRRACCCRRRFRRRVESGCRRRDASSVVAGRIRRRGLAVRVRRTARRAARISIFGAGRLDEFLSAGSGGSARRSARSAARARPS